MNRDALKYLLLLAGVLLCTMSCSDDDATGTSPEEALGVEVTSSEVYRPMELTQAIAFGDYLAANGLTEQEQQKLVNRGFDALTAGRVLRMDSIFHRRHQESGFLSFRKWQVESYCFTYQSVSASGQPITLSGRVTLPNMKDGSGHEVSTLSLYLHHHLKGQQEAPTHSLSPIALRVLMNSAVIEPDLEGYGVTADRFACGISFATQARQAIDCVLAALRVMKSHGVSLAADGHTSAWGVSLGAPVAVATARYYEEQLTLEQRKAIRLQDAYCGSGPYMLADMMDYWDENPAANAYMARYMLMFIHALSTADLRGYKPSDFMPEWMQSYQVQVDSKMMAFYDALLQYKNDERVFDLWPETFSYRQMRNSMASDMTMTDGRLARDNAKTQALLDIMRTQSDWGDWMPTTTLFLTHCQDDPYMPYEQSQAFYQQKQRSGSVYWKNVSPGLAGFQTNIHDACTLNALLAMVLYEEPAGAFNNDLNYYIDL